ncbi:MAG: hypothetical protein KC422_22235 [Trueperaceae bacterium]|nr:hypothetical protein [Trueperaceae bacterium]
MFFTPQAQKSRFVSFKEKANLLTIISIFLTYGFYFFRVFQADFKSLQLGMLLSVTIIFIFIQILTRSMLPFVFKHQRQIKMSMQENEAILKANRVAYFVLLSGVMTSLLLSILNAASFWLNLNIVFFVVLSEITKFSAELVLLHSSQLLPKSNEQRI